MAPWKGASVFFILLFPLILATVSGAVTRVLQVNEKAIAQRFFTEGHERFIFNLLIVALSFSKLHPSYGIGVRKRRNFKLRHFH